MALSEFDLIARLFAPQAGEGGLGLLDDAALLAPSPGYDLVLTTDAIVEGVHFFPDDPPDTIARKVLGVNLSDLAAKGASPRAFLLTLGRGARQDDAWLEAFASGLASASRAAGIVLLGGDTVKAGQAFFSISAFGEVPRGKMVRRQAGGPGDILLVSGAIGDAALGLALRGGKPAWGTALNEGQRAELLDRYLVPRPRLALAGALLAHASAAMDVSDGLVGDLDKLAGHLGAEIDIAAVPLSGPARAALAADPTLLETILTGGDDYEILAAVPGGSAEKFSRDALRAGLPVAKIGQLKPADSGIVWRDETGAPVAFRSRSYRHF